MILYTIIYNDQIVDWAGTQADAKAECKSFDSQNPVRDAKPAIWKEHNVPVDKPSLLAWLKKYAVNLGEAQVEIMAEALHQVGILPPIPQLDMNMGSPLGTNQTSPQKDLDPPWDLSTTPGVPKY